MLNGETVMRELENFVYQEVVISHGERIAFDSAAALFECLWLNFRKQNLYVPSTYNQASILEERNKAIWRDFNGTNHADLSVKYRLSLQQIYAITRRMRTKSSERSNRAGRPCAESKNKPLTMKVIEEYLPSELIKCGMSDVEAQILADKIAGFLCQNFPGVVIKVNDTLKATRQETAPPSES